MQQFLLFTLHFVHNINMINLRDVLRYAYYNNLAPIQKIIYQKCHRHCNELYKRVLAIRVKLNGIFTFTELLNKLMSSLTIRQLKMSVDNRLLVSLDLNNDYSRYSWPVDHKMFFPEPNFNDYVRYSETFLDKNEAFWQSYFHYYFYISRKLNSIFSQQNYKT